MRSSRALVTVIAAVVLAVASAQPAAAVSTTVAVWQMEDTGTTMADSTGHGHTGTLHAVTVGRPGFSGKAFGFFGHPSYVAVPTAVGLNPGSAAFAITLHLRFGALPSESVGDFDVLRKGLATTDGGSYKIEVLESGKAFCDFRGSTAEGRLTSSAALATGVWHTITCARTPTSMRLVVDGRAVSRSVTTGVIANTGSLYIGAKNGSGADQVTGLIDAVSISKG